MAVQQRDDDGNGAITYSVDDDNSGIITRAMTACQGHQ
jgi:hypothetical protein